MGTIEEITKTLDEYLIENDKEYLLLSQANQILENKGILTVSEKIDKALKSILEEGLLSHAYQTQTSPKQWRIPLSKQGQLLKEKIKSGKNEQPKSNGIHPVNYKSNYTTPCPNCGLKLAIPVTSEKSVYLKCLTCGFNFKYPLLINERIQSNIPKVKKTPFLNHSQIVALIIIAFFLLFWVINRTKDSSFKSSLVTYDTVFNNGYVKIYNSTDKKIVSEGKLERNVKDSIWRYYYPDGNLHTVINFKHGIKEGNFVLFDSSGSMLQAMYKQNELDGLAIEYYKSDKKQIKSKTTYKAGQKEGTYTEFFPDGKVRIKANYINDKKNGCYERYEYNEQFNSHFLYCKGFYNEDMLNGKWHYYDYYFDPGTQVYKPELILTNIKTYENGSLNGLYIEYDIQHGFKLIETNFLNDLEHGIRKSYCPYGEDRGKLWIVEYYENGELIRKDPYKCGCRYSKNN